MPRLHASIDTLAPIIDDYLRQFLRRFAEFHASIDFIRRISFITVI